ncbi:hypothetical protein O3P69_006068 [Scylla paramamosain]|uniref:SMP-30/Gluconolactonase/LRE-like region domain-containing protein n=1 Tax=Scylla paramamosain TaxID=85552 RepID=A0AAW0U4R7_SCYPA
MGECVQQLPLPCLELGEGPHWVEQQQALLVVDVKNKTLIKHYVSSGRTQNLHIDGVREDVVVTMAIPVEGEEDLWVVGLGNTLSVVRWAESDPDDHTAKATIIHATNDYQFNDAKCDPQGRLWIGTMSKLDDQLDPINPKSCFLYKYDNQLDLTTWAKDATLSNGMAWSSDKKHFYFADSFDRCVYHFDYDDAEGTVSGQRVLLDFETAGLTGVPDGMTIDQDDNLWLACFFASKVVCVDPRQQKVVRSVPVPAKSVTSVCWGGKDYGTLYVTSGTIKMTEEERAASPSAGGTFAVTGLGTRGRPPMTFKPDLTKLRAKLTQ